MPFVHQWPRSQSISRWSSGSYWYNIAECKEFIFLHLFRNIKRNNCMYTIEQSSNRIWINLMILLQLFPIILYLLFYYYMYLLIYIYSTLIVISNYKKKTYECLCSRMIDHTHLCMPTASESVSLHWPTWNMRYNNKISLRKQITYWNFVTATWLMPRRAGRKSYISWWFFFVFTTALI